MAARRYAALAIANLASVMGNHEALTEEGALTALFTLSSSADVMSQFYVAYALANFSANEDNHLKMVGEGGLQPVISLAYSNESDVQQQAAAALRGLVSEYESE